MATADPLEPLVKIGESLREAAAALGLDVQAFAVMPDFSGGTSHAIQVVFTLNDDAIAALEQPVLPDLEHDDELAAELEALWAGGAEAEKEQLRDLARESQKEKEDEAVANMLRLRERLNKGDSILGDD